MRRRRDGQGTHKEILLDGLELDIEWVSKAFEAMNRRTDNVLTD